MKKIYSTLVFTLLCQLFSFSQLTCGSTFTDSGDIDSSYTNDEIDTFYLCPMVLGDVIQLNFASFDLEDGYDFMTIYDGNVAGVNPIGTYTGTQGPGIISAENTSGCLTIIFTSDISITGTGWEAAVTCIPAPTCLKPTNFTASNVTSNAATFDWQVNNSESAWIIEYGTPGFVPGTGTIVLANAHPKTISTFSQMTVYDVYIRANCAVGDTSAYLGPIQISTNPNPLTCGDTFLDSGSDTSDYQVNEDYIYTACPGLSTETVQVVFSAFDIEDGFDFMTIYDANDTITGTEIGTYTGTTSPGTLIAQNVAGCLTFRFTSDDIIPSAGWVAAVTCVPELTCLKPSFLQVDTTLLTSATLSWTSNDTETQWLVEYGPVGFTQGTGTEVVANANPFNLTGLTASTAYEYYVSALCAGNDSSLVSGPQNFTTAIAPFTCGNILLDNGNLANYNNSSNDTLTICPTGNAEYVQLVFSEFNTESGYDSLMIFNGMSTADSLLGIFQGVDTLGTIVSTGVSGCLTLVFASDNTVNRPGWVATIECIDANASIAENEKEVLSIYPNPSAGKFTIENLNNSTLSYELRDMQGRKLPASSLQLKSNEKTTLDLSNFDNGIYFLVVNTGTGTQTYSLVKN